MSEGSCFVELPFELKLEVASHLDPASRFSLSLSAKGFSDINNGAFGVFFAHDCIRNGYASLLKWAVMECGCPLNHISLLQLRHCRKNVADMVLFLLERATEIFSSLDLSITQSFRKEGYPDLNKVFYYYCLVALSHSDSPLPEAVSLALEAYLSSKELTLFDVQRIRRSNTDLEVMIYSYLIEPHIETRDPWAGKMEKWLASTPRSPIRCSIKIDSPIIDILFLPKNDIPLPLQYFLEVDPRVINEAVVYTGLIRILEYCEAHRAVETARHLLYRLAERNVSLKMFNTPRMYLLVSEVIETKNVDMGQLLIAFDCIDENPNYTTIYDSILVFMLVYPTLSQLEILPQHKERFDSLLKKVTPDSFDRFLSHSLQRGFVIPNSYEAYFTSQFGFKLQKRVWINEIVPILNSLETNFLLGRVDEGTVIDQCRSVLRWLSNKRLLIGPADNEDRFFSPIRLLKQYLILFRYWEVLDIALECADANDMILLGHALTTEPQLVAENIVTGIGISSSSYLRRCLCKIIQRQGLSTTSVVERLKGAVFSSSKKLARLRRIVDSLW